MTKILKSMSFKEYIALFISSIMILISLLFTSVSAFSANYYLTLAFKIMFFALTSVSILLICIKDRTNISFVIFGLELIYFVTGIISLSLNISSIKEWMLSFGVLGEIIILINLSLLARRVFSQKLLLFITIFLSVIVFAACLYSNIAEASNIYNSIIAKGEDSHFYQIKSFFNSRNSYGFIIFFDISLLVFLFFRVKKYKFLLIPIILYFFVNLVFSRCKIAIFTTIIVLLTLCVLFLIKLWFRSRFRFFVVVSCAFIVLALLICIVFVPQIFNKFDFLKKLNNYISEGFYGQAVRSIQSRIIQFENIVPLFSNIRLLIGYGENSTSIKIDNAYVSLLLTGGIPKVFLFACILYHSLGKILYLNKYDKNSGSLLISIFVCFILYGLFEGFSVLGTSFFSLAWIFILLLVPSTLIHERKSQNFNESRHVLHVVGSFNKGGTEAFILNYFGEIKKHSDIIFDVYCFGNADLEQVNKLRNLGGNIYFGKPPCPKKILSELFAFKAFLKKNNKYQIVHCSANFDNFIYLHVANLLDVSCRIQHSHDTLTGIVLSKFKKIIFLFKRILNNYNSNKTFACSDEAGYDIIGKRFFSKFGKVIPNCVDVDRFSKLDKERVNVLKNEFNLQNKKVFGNISRFEDKKNQQFILEIFNEYHKSNSDSVLVLGGVDGGNLLNIKRYASQIPSSDSIIFIGPRSDVEDWLHIIDVYLMPSLFEGFGISAIEAQIAGAYVIASDRLPKITDIGLNRISYLSLNETSPWIEKMGSENNKDDLKISNLYYDIKVSYKILLEEYSI